MNPYSLLGLTKGATISDVKKAFRKLAMRWHPDRNPDPTAIEQFKVMRAAYEQLLATLEGRADDPEADNGDVDDPSSDDCAPDADPAKPPPRGRGRDRVRDLTVELEEALLGCNKAVTLEAFATCEICDGAGRETLERSSLCTDCHGSGKLRAGQGLINCGTCNGKGYSRIRVCKTCAGTGKVGSERTISVKVPAGRRQGDFLRVPGEGDATEDDTGDRGDLKLRIAIAPHPLFSVAELDLVLQRPVSGFRLMLGGEVEVPIPGGTQKLRIEPGPPEKCDARIPGIGFPGRHGEPDGDLIIHLHPVFPDGADPDLAREIASLQKMLDRDQAKYLAEIAKWEARWL